MTKTRRFEKARVIEARTDAFAEGAPYSAWEAHSTSLALCPLVSLLDRGRFQGSRIRKDASQINAFFKAMDIQRRRISRTNHRQDTYE